MNRRDLLKSLAAIPVVGLLFSESKATEEKKLTQFVHYWSLRDVQELEFSHDVDLAENRISWICIAKMHSGDHRIVECDQPYLYEHGMLKASWRESEMDIADKPSIRLSREKVHEIMCSYWDVKVWEHMPVNVEMYVAKDGSHQWTPRS